MLPCKTHAYPSACKPHGSIAAMMPRRMLDLPLPQHAKPDAALAQIQAHLTEQGACGDARSTGHLPVASRHPHTPPAAASGVQLDAEGCPHLDTWMMSSWSRSTRGVAGGKQRPTTCPRDTDSAQPTHSHQACHRCMPQANHAALGLRAARVAGRTSQTMIPNLARTSQSPTHTAAAYSRPCVRTLQAKQGSATPAVTLLSALLNLSH